MLFVRRTAPGRVYCKFSLCDCHPIGWTAALHDLVEHDLVGDPQYLADLAALRLVDAANLNLGHLEHFRPPPHTQTLAHYCVFTVRRASGKASRFCGKFKQFIGSPTP